MTNETMHKTDQHKTNLNQCNGINDGGHKDDSPPMHIQTHIVAFKDVCTNEYYARLEMRTQIGKKRDH